MSYNIKLTDWPVSNRTVSVKDVTDLECRIGEWVTVSSSMQNSLELALASLDVRVYSTLVIMSAVSPQWLLNAVVNAGGTPIVLDCGTTGELLDTVQLEQSLQAVDNDAIVIYYAPFGESIPSHQKLLFAEALCIYVSDAFPGTSLETQGVMDIHDMTPAMSSGAALVNGYRDQWKNVRLCRKSMHGDYVSPYEAVIAGKFLNTAMKDFNHKVSMASHLYEQACTLRGIGFCLPHADVKKHYPVKVTNAQAVHEALALYGVETARTLNCLVPAGKYINADLLMHNKVLLLPSMVGLTEPAEIVDLIKSIELNPRR